MPATQPHAVIIGGTSGIGLATAARLLAGGYRVTVAGRDKARLENALARLAEAATDAPAGGTGAGTSTAPVSGQVVDAADAGGVRAFFAGLGPVDHLVVTATAPAGMAPVAELAADRLRGAFDGKLLAHLYCIQAALPSLAADGSITLVSAASARGGLPGTAGLAAINGAIEAMVKPLAVELAPRRVNVVSPGFIDTAWWDWMPAEAKAAAFAQAAKITPVGRVGRAEDVADAITFLIGNTFTTGVVLPCDGGALLTPAS
jgi:NAD(P)-dependent dehydrogenase (short-subunit alcohol dehydrogenase family)